jgi:hypothetical protein
LERPQILQSLQNSFSTKAQEIERGIHMPDPATVFQSSGLNVPYQYTPVVTHLNPPIQLPETGQLWAEVGKTALSAGQQLQQSALNPAVREQMKYGVDQYRRGQEAIAFNRQLGPLGNIFVQTGPEGTTIVPGANISDPTLAAMYQAALKLVPQPGKGDKVKAPDVNNPVQPVQPAPAQQQTPAQEPTPKPPTTQEMGKGQTSAATTSGLAASTDNDFLIGQMMQERQAAGLGGSEAAQQGTPAGMTFLNPATGNVQPLQTPSVFAPQAAAPPPPAPTQAQAPGSAISQITQQPGVALANWQNQNVHPVIAPKAVLDAVKTNVSTAAQDATYLPSGGVNGEPAWAIHMKGGGQTTISASQLATSPWGRALMATHNASEVMEAQANQPGQPQPGQAQTNQPGNMLLQAPPGQAGQPPAAPGAPGMAAVPPQPPGPPVPAAAPGMTDIYGNPLSAYTNVASAGGLTPDQLMAQTAPAAQPAQPAVQPGQPIHPAPSNSTLPQADQDAIQAQANRMGAPPAGKYEGDRRIEGTTGPYTYYRDDDPTSPSVGRAYTTLPGPAGQYYDQQRWYLGTREYTPYELPESAARQQMWDKWGVTGFLTRAEIDHMKPKAMEPWLQRAWQNENYQRSSPVEGLNNTLTASEQYHNSLTKIRDIIQTLGEHGYQNLSSRDKLGAQIKNAAVSLGIGPLVPGMDENAAAAIRDLDEEVGRAHDLLKAHPELSITPGEAEGINLPPIKLPLSTEIPEPSIPSSDVISDSAWSGRSVGTRLKNLNGLLAQGDDRYKDLIHQSQTQWMRIDPRHDANLLKIDQGIDLKDDTNHYRDHTYPSEFPTISPEEYTVFAKTHPPGTPFMTKGPNPQKLVTPPR